eukprot:TRINITY_DN4435_c3_g1_i1.p2 TRINITY_DN4435_c3_g1~~TRINITY_DN4435_c3_g1_i1.p2  ORF type:complete len:303 (+),score=116.52 TRINITY_DN4435_c3_g1_i1:81-911(+)
MKRWKQAVRQAVGASERTQDDSYDEADRELRALAKLARELPKAILAVADGLRQLWKTHSRLAAELRKAPEALGLPQPYGEATQRLAALSAELEAARGDQLQRELQASAADGLAAIEHAARALERYRDERGEKLLEYDAARDSSRQRLGELQKKGRADEQDPVLQQRRRAEDEARELYQSAHRVCVEEMAKVASAKDAVLRRYAAASVMALSGSLAAAARDLADVGSALSNCPRAPPRPAQPPAGGGDGAGEGQPGADSKSRQSSQHRDPADLAAQE